MAKNCAYCRKSLNVFSGSNLLCGDSEELFCSDCYNLLYEFDRYARGKAVLEHGLPAKPGAIRVSLEQHTIAEEEKQAAEVHSGLPCVRCHVPMTPLGRKKFQMGEHSFWGGDHSHLMEGSLEVELLVCPQCRRLEYLLPEDSEMFPAPKAEAEEKPAVPPPPSVPGIGKRVPWER